MKKAQAAKPPVQKLGDKVASIFVPVVILIALFTFVITYFATNAGLQNSICTLLLCW
jgi:Cu+-exporting ATPase